MYNDYYLQQINTTLEEINEKITTITEKQENIITEIKTLQTNTISGDYNIQEAIINTHNAEMKALEFLCGIIVAILLYHFFNFILEKKG